MSDYSMDETLMRDIKPSINENQGANDMTLLHESAKLIGHAATPGLAINGILRLMSQMLGLNRGRVVTFGEDPSKLEIKYSYGLSGKEIARGVYRYGEGITGRVMQSQQVTVVQNVDEEQNYLFKAIDRETLPSGVVAYFAVPIFDGSTTVGVLACHRLRMRPRALKADLQILQILATMIAQVLRINTLIEERTSALQRENLHLKESLQSRAGDSGIIGESIAIQSALAQASQVADTPVTVLLTGESGTGKERFSQYLHLNSSRRKAPFIAVNCAAIPENLLESELFGHEKGAFTGATSVKQGKLELANSGTLFLDEIGDLSLDLQTKLLRVLEDHSIQRVGGNRAIPIDVRIVTATHKNLQESVNKGTFRLDLFYRLNVFPLNLPPLRARGNDIGILSRHFIIRANNEFQRNTVFENGVIERLVSYNWPGNIRQLENVIKRAVLIANESIITVRDIELILFQESAINQEQKPEEEFEVTLPSATPLASGYNQPQYQSPQYLSQPMSQRPYSWVSENQTGQILEALEKTGGNKTRAAALLGMTARQFRYRLEKLGL